MSGLYRLNKAELPMSSKLNCPSHLMFTTTLCLCQLAGIAILGVGIWVKVDSGSILNFLGKIENAPAELSQVLNVGYLLIALGALLVIIGFLGCCGAVRESKCMLLMVGHCMLLYKGSKKRPEHKLESKLKENCFSLWSL